jgi:DNA-binding transcriptional LysR family regulator
MSRIDHFNLRSFDLNQLVAFDALVTERSVTKAAARLKIRQPAMSHSLSTLRLLLQDDLLVRVGHAMQPTAKALELTDPVRKLLGEVQQLILATSDFDPSTSRHSFRFAATNEIELVLLPALGARLSAVAPNIRLQMIQSSPDEVMQQLAEGDVDLAVGCFGPAPAHLRTKDLFIQSLACCFNPALVDLESSDPLSMPQVALADNEGIYSCLEAVLESTNFRPDIVFTAPDFLSLLATAAEAPLVATVPKKIADKYARMFQLCVIDVGDLVKVPPVSMMWAATADQDAPNRWLRGMIDTVLVT